MCKNIDRKPPLSSVYRADSGNPHELIWDLSDSRVKAKHFENAIPMALLYWTRELGRRTEDLSRLELRVPAARSAEAYCLYLQKFLIDPQRLRVDVLIGGEAQQAEPPVFPETWRTIISAGSPSRQEITDIMAGSGLPIVDGMLFYQNVTDRSAGIVQGRIFGLKVLTISLASRRVKVEVGDPEKGLGLKISNWKQAEHLSDAQLLQRISEERANAQDSLHDLYSEQEEHYLESRLLGLISSGGPLPAPWRFILDGEVFFQFPVVTARAGNPRYIDILARCGEAPAVIEIKVAPDPANESEYYFQALGQAMSYAGYLKAAFSNAPLAGIPALFQNVRQTVLFPDFRENHQYLRGHYTNLVAALNAKLHAGNAMNMLTVDLGSWQQARAVEFTRQP